MLLHTFNFIHCFDQRLIHILLHQDTHYTTFHTRSSQVAKQASSKQQQAKQGGEERRGEAVRQERGKFFFSYHHTVKCVQASESSSSSIHIAKGNRRTFELQLSKLSSGRKLFTVARTMVRFRHLFIRQVAFIGLIRRRVY